MKKLLTLAIVALLAWRGYESYNQANAHATPDSPAAASDATQPLLAIGQSASNNESTPFTCDGREYCSQMTSCEEAKFFIRQCPNTNMDGDNDGIPCESQWCGKL